MTISIVQKTFEFDLEKDLKAKKGYSKEILEQVSTNEQSIKQVISLIEPMMILLMALVIGFIVISMLLAIFSANDISF